VISLIEIAVSIVGVFFLGFFAIGSLKTSSWVFSMLFLDHPVKDEIVLVSHSVEKVLEELA